MYATLNSPSSSWADSTVFEPGLRSNSATPVLCCPAVAVVAVKAAAAVVGAAAGSASSGSDNNCTVDGCVGCVADSYACGGYVTPGRLVNFSGVIADDASVEELLSVTTARRA